MLVSSLSAENLFDNSTMDTAGGWKGSKKFVVEEKDPAKTGAADGGEKKKEKEKENRVLAVDAKKRERVSFSQKVSLRGLTDLTLKFRYRTKDYNGRGLELRGKRQDGSFTFNTRDFQADGEWHQVEWSYTQVNGSNSIEFEIVVLEGEGEIFFDDVTVESAR